MTHTRIDAHTIEVHGLTVAEIRDHVRFGPDGQDEPLTIREEDGRIFVTHAQPGPLNVWA